jgi:putative DNA primase/helicase
LSKPIFDRDDFESKVRADLEAVSPKSDEADNNVPLDLRTTAGTAEGKPKADEQMSFGPFKMKHDGLYYYGKKEEVRIADRFEVLGRARDPNEWARLICFRDADLRQHRVVIKDASLHADPGMLVATLAGQGLMVSARHRRELVDYLNAVDGDQRVTMVACTGWHKIGDQPVFVLPNESLGKPASEVVVLNGTEISPYAVRGTLADWQNGIARRTAGQRLGVLAVSTAFAGPLLILVRSDGGGIHYRGLSSIGKTSHLRCAASVWGPPTFVRSWRATANALEATAQQHTDTLLALDELNAGTGREVYAAAYQLSAGIGKGRSHRDSSARKPKT